VTVVDLRSDTVTRPGPAMRAAMASAEVGDDVYGEDPTVLRLQEVAARLVGKPAAIFVPSGTMANQIAIRAQTEPGDALIAGRDAHVYLYEGGGAAALSGVQAVLVGEDGLFTADDVRAAVAPRDPHFARTRLVCVENTHNRSGGRVFPLAAQRAIAAVARERGLALHLDGARLFNAAVATGTSAAELAAPYDSVSFCLSKGLGAPAGSLLCGSAELIERAHRVRKLFGGGMRQAGILAAAGLLALEQHVERLAEDHARARRLAEGLAAIEGVEVAAAPETNMVLCDVAGVASFVEALRTEGVRVGAVGPRTLRLVTHLDVDDAGVEQALAAFARVAAGTR
jgi:threonine aldolase